MGDAVAAAKRRGLRVIARLDLSKVSAGVAAEHPDWLFVSAIGEPQIHNGLYSACLSGELYQKRAVEILDRRVPLRRFGRPGVRHQRPLRLEAEHGQNRLPPHPSPLGPNGSELRPHRER
ncbi:hypothetical protein AB0F79_21970 [Nocardia fluminea]